MKKSQNQYSDAHLRAQWWDYGWSGAYFITICTANREHFFGEIENGKMRLSPTGVVADIFWHEITRSSPFVELGDFVVMPNHIHGILILDKPFEKPLHTVGPLHATAGPPTEKAAKPLKDERMSAISPKANSVSSIIRSYKSAVTKHANRLGLPNGWQSLFHDHIIRDNSEYQRISDYIVDNPAKWESDRFCSK